MSETILVNAATVLAGASTAVVAHQMVVPGIQFRVVSDKAYTARFYVADTTFSSIANAAEISGTDDSHAATSGIVYDVDPGAYDYVACVVTNTAATQATVTIAAGYDLVAEAPTALFTVAEARLFVDAGDTPLSDSNDYPNAALIAAEAHIRELFESACDVSFIPTVATETIDGAWSRLVRVSRRNPAKELPRRPITVSAASIDGVALSVTQLAALKPYPDGRITRVDGASWSSSTSYQDLAVSITYTHGWATVPDQIKQAALMLCVRLLVGNDVPMNATSFSDGGATFSLTYAGAAPHWTGLAWVDAVLDRYRENRAVAL